MIHTEGCYENNRTMKKKLPKAEGARKAWESTEEGFSTTQGPGDGQEARRRASGRSRESRMLCC